MTAAALTDAPDEPDTAPTGCGEGSDEHGRHPAPLATMLAVLGRVASHAGGVMTMTVTEPGQRVAVMVGDRPAYARWCRELFGPDVEPGEGVQTGTEGCLHGWSIAVYLSRPAR
jgi:hypothetical protein